MQDLIAFSRNAGPKRTSASDNLAAETPGKTAQTADAVNLFLARSIESDAYLHLFPARGHLLEKSLAVLKLARDEFGIDGLTASQVGTILIKKFRVAGVHLNNVSRDLGNSTQFLSRVKDNGEYRYLMTNAGEQYLETVRTQLRSSP